MRQFNNEFAKLGVACLVVTFESRDQARRYVDEFKVDWPLLLDQDRTVYRAYDLEERASIWNLFRPQFCPRYVALMFSGRKVRRPTGDIHQMGGDVLIDPSGVVRLHHPSETPLDRPAPDEVLSVIRGEPVGGE